VNGAVLTVAVKPLTLQANNLVLGPIENRAIKRQIDGRGFVDDVAIGDWISIHWDWACQVLTAQQVENLAKWTDHHLRLANQTL
jgi:hydrogenase maturation factor